MYTILQTKRNSTHNANAVAKHYWVLNNFNHIYTSIGVNATFSEFYSQDEQHLSDGSVNDFNVAGFGNDFGYDFINTFLGLEYKLQDRKSTRLNSSHVAISYAVFCLKKKNIETE